MRLDRNQMQHYQYEIRRNTGKIAIIHENGIFEIYDIDESDKNRVLNQLRNLDFIESTNVGSQKYDFSNFDFSQGYAKPKQTFSIRGLLKPQEELEEDVLDEAYTRQKMIDWLYGRRNENVSRMAENTVIDYANGLAMEARLRQHDDEHMIKIGNLLDQLYSISQRNRYNAAQNYISRLISEYNNQMEGNMTTNTKNKLRFGESVEIHDELNPAIWTENKELKPEVEDKIEDIVDTFIEILKEKDIDIKVEDIYLLGSNANYNYNESSDIDIHIIADEESFNCNKDHLPIIYDCMKTLFNKKYDISIYGINVELYVENAKQLSNVATGIYSLNDGWIKDPSKYEIPEIDNEKINREVTEWSNKYQNILANPSYDVIEDYIDALYELRTKSIQTEGEFGEGNLIFKEVRRKGILDDLKDLKDEIESKELSLESLKENWNVRFDENLSILDDEYLDEGRLLKNLGKAALIALAAGSSIAGIAGIHNKANNENEQLNNVQKQVEVVQQCLETLPETITIHSEDIASKFKDKNEIKQGDHTSTKTENEDGTVSYHIYNDLVDGDYIDFTVNDKGHLVDANTANFKETKGSIAFDQKNFNYTIDKETGKYTKTRKMSDNPDDNQGVDFTSKELSKNDYNVKDVALTYTTTGTEIELTKDLSILQDKANQLDANSQQTKTIKAIIDSLIASGWVAAGILGASKKKEEDLDEALLESAETNLYQYDGPVYGYNDEELGYFKDFVLARSAKEALNRINYKIKLKLHMDPKKSVIYLEPECLNLVEVDYEDDAVVSHEKCSECGQLLNDAGECPVCDLGDNTLDEEVHRQTLLKDLKYTNIDEFLNGQEIITHLSKLDREKYLQAFSDAGFINDLDEIIIPKNTQLTYKTSKEYNGNTYDIFYVKGNPKCLIAVNVYDIVDLFGESLKKNKEDKKKASKLKFGN